MGIVSIRYSQKKIYKRLSLLWKFNSIFVIYSHADVITYDGWVGKYDIRKAFT